MISKKEAPMLEMRPNCECCDADLPAEAGGAMICSFECTFCADCADRRLHGVCPNCAGALIGRPTRVGAMLAKYPQPAKRTLRAAPCPG